MGRVGRVGRVSNREREQKKKLKRWQRASHYEKLVHVSIGINHEGCCIPK